MPIDVEANLRIPSLTIRPADEAARRIDNSLVRFTKLIQVPEIPKPGTALPLTTGSGETFESTVTRADWHEGQERFVVSCTYAKKSISADLYGALVSDAAWVMKPLGSA